MSVALAKLQNLMWDIKLIPTQIEVSYKSNKCMKDPEYINKLQEKAAKKEEKRAEKAQKKQDAETMKAAKKAANEDREEAFSDTVRDNIVNMSNGDNIFKMNLVGRAIETNKLIQFTNFYMTSQEAQLIKLNQKEREIVNGIAQLFDFGKIYESAGIASLKLYDPDCKEDYVSTSKYLLSIKDIEAKKNDQAFMEKLASRKEQLLAESQHPEDDEPVTETEETTTSSRWVKDKDGIIHPIFVLPEDEVIIEPEVQGVGISDDLFKLLEDKFNPFLNGIKHRYELSGDLVLLYVTREGTGAEEYYTVDPTGIVMGGGKTYILANTGTDTLFVSTEHNDIVSNVLSSVFYILRPEEIQKVFQDYFRNMVIYRYVDMSNTEFLKDLDTKSLQKLGKKLTFIINQVANQNQGQSQLPRFRFNFWNGIDDFLLISDPAVKSPLKHIGETSDLICEGLMFEVKGDDVTQRFKGYNIEYHIDKYGDM